MLKNCKIAILLLFGISISNGVDAWDNAFTVESGYRIDSFEHNGSFISPSIHHFKQEIPHLSLFQVDVEDRLTWCDYFFAKGIVGYGFGFHTSDHARGTVHLLVPPLASNELPQPYDVQADSFDFNGKDIFEKKETSFSTLRSTPTKVSRHLYSHKHGGAHGWNIDFSVGMTIPILNNQSIEPRIGYLFQSLKAKHVTSTYFQGIYAGLAVPIIYDCFRVIPDISFAFCGNRHETIDYFCQFHSSYKKLHAQHGQVLGFRASIAVEYFLSCQSCLGIVWKYSNFHTGSGHRLKINKAVSWKPHTKWQSQQFLGTYTYFF